MANSISTTGRHALIQEFVSLVAVVTFAAVLQRVAHLCCSWRK